MITFHVITLFPDFIKEYFTFGVVKRGFESNLFDLKVYNLRDFAFDKHKTVDDRPFGGGPGMVLKIEPWDRALHSIRKDIESLYKGKSKDKEAKGGEVLVWLLSPSGKLFTQNMAYNLVKRSYRNSMGPSDNQKNTLNNSSYIFKKVQDIHLVLLSGRYEGVDARIEEFIDDKISIGPYILSGGELPALVIIDAIVRLIPGVTGNPKSPLDETHFVKKDGNIEVDQEYPQYTRPAVYKSLNGKVLKVPVVLKTGNHKEIEKWRKMQRKKSTEEL